MWHYIVSLQRKSSAPLQCSVAVQRAVTYTTGSYAMAPSMPRPPSFVCTSLVIIICPVHPCLTHHRITDITEIINIFSNVHDIQKPNYGQT